MPCEHLGVEAAVVAEVVMAGSRLERDWLRVADVVEYLGVEPVTVYRWCRDGRLPCVKLGKEWRIRRSAIEEFLRRAEQNVSLAGQLRSFYAIPDHVIAIAETQLLLHRADTAFFQIGEARGGTLVKFHNPKAVTAETLRGHFARYGLDVERLEAAGRFRFVEEGDPVQARPLLLQRLHDELTGEGRSVWASFDWVQQVGLDEALRQQEALAQVIDADRLVVQTGVLEQVMDDWSLATQRRARHLHRGAIWISATGLSMSRVAPLPPA